MEFRVLFNFFKKKKVIEKNRRVKFEIELTASILAYEIARSDGNISDEELAILLNEIKKIAKVVNKPENKILELVEEYSKNSVSFYEFIEDINNTYTKNEKLSLISFLWEVAYADSILEVNEEKLIRRVAELIKVKNLDVLKLKDKYRKSSI